MDGYAVRAEDTITANDTHPLQLELGPQAQVVDTGDPLPGWADAVIMIENVQPIGSIAHRDSRADCAVDVRAAAGRRHGRDRTGLARESHLAPGRSRRAGGQRTCHRQCAKKAARRRDSHRHRIDHRRAGRTIGREIGRHHRIQLDRVGRRSRTMGRRCHALPDRDRQLRSDQSRRGRCRVETRSRPHQRGIIGRQRRLHGARRARVGNAARPWCCRASRSSCHSGHDQSDQGSGIRHFSSIPQSPSSVFPAIPSLRR